MKINNECKALIYTMITGYTISLETPMLEIKQSFNFYVTQHTPLSVLGIIYINI